MFFLALLAILILGTISFGLLKLLSVSVANRRNHSRQEPETPPTQANPKQEDNEQLSTLIRKIDEYHEQDTKRAKGDRLETLMFLLWGFALTTGGLALAMIRIPSTNWTIGAIIVSIGTAIVFLALAIRATRKLRQYKPLDWKDFWGDKT